MTQITNEQINALRTEAAEHGDREQVSICDAALRGDAAALAECQRVLEDALAQQD